MAMEARICDRHIQISICWFDKSPPQLRIQFLRGNPNNLLNFCWFLKKRRSFLCNFSSACSFSSMIMWSTTSYCVHRAKLMLACHMHDACKLHALNGNRIGARLWQFWARWNNLFVLDPMWIFCGKFGSWFEDKTKTNAELEWSLRRRIQVTLFWQRLFVTTFERVAVSFECVCYEQIHTRHQPTRWYLFLSSNATSIHHGLSLTHTVARWRRRSPTVWSY